ncbi:UNVERIFIED_CONTAM: hypothetical protein HHA_289160 [Hammondia hammondi]|eukprot:XP_008889097.1 hypothetical protein HHA_289160 [Hammondia hammondi]
MGKYEERKGDDMKTGSAKVEKTRGPVTLAIKTAIGAVRMRCLYTRPSGTSQDTRSTGPGATRQKKLLLKSESSGKYARECGEERCSTALSKGKSRC